MVRTRMLRGSMNAIEAVRSYLVRRIPGCEVSPFTDVLTRAHGTVGFTIVVGESIRTIDVACELLGPGDLPWLDDLFDRFGVVGLLSASEGAAIVVTPAGAHPLDERWERDDVPTAEALPRPVPEHPRPLASEPAGFRTYLVVEDDPEVAQAVDHCLRTLGRTPCLVSRIAEAEKLLAILRFDGILVDLDLPDGDGLRWLDSLVHSERGFRGTKVLGAGGALPADRRDELERTGAAFLEKPFPLEALADALGASRTPQP